MKSANHFRKTLTDAITTASKEILKKIGKEKLYAFSLYTSSEDHYTYVAVSANTEEGLEECCQKYAVQYPDSAGFDRERGLRWSVPDWKYHGFSTEVESMELPPGEGRERDLSLYKDFVFAMKALEKKRVFSHIDPRVLLLIMCGDMSERFLLKGLQALNPTKAVASFKKEFTSATYIHWLRSLPPIEQLETLFNLYRDLSLDRSSQFVADSRARNLSVYDLEPLFRKQGEDGVSRLIDLIEEFGYGTIFHNKDSPEIKKYGAFTLEARLSTSAVFVIEKCKSVNDQHIQRLQSLLAKRVTLDKGLAITTTLGENIARVLHKLRPKRFPRSKMGAKNHLANPEPFLNG